METDKVPLVLVVDDDAHVREAIVDILDIAGVDTLTASNGKDGVAVYVANHQKIDLVILDLLMPVMDGEETLVQLLSFNRNARVLIASGFGEANRVRQLVGQGAVGFLHKPFDLHKLLTTVNAQLGLDGDDALSIQESAETYRI